ncbi:hypothetical protein ACG7TL_008761 [Trametes sanguinea]
MHGNVLILDYDKFLNCYVSALDRETDQPRTQYCDVALPDFPLGTKTSAMCSVFAKKLNASGLATDTGYRFVDTPTGIKPGPANDPDEVVDSELHIICGMRLPLDVHGKTTGEIDWSTVEVLFMCNADDIEGDPFDDDANTEALSDDRRKVLGQFLACSRYLFNGEHRTHLFNVIICGSHARLARLDHGGIVVTKKFNYKTEPEKLLEFIWRLARLEPEHLGHDMSATPMVAGSEEYLLMKSRADNPRCDGTNKLQEHARAAFQKSLQCAHWWKLRVDDESDPLVGPKTKYFLVGKPHFVAAKGLVGRATRGFVAIDLGDPQGPFVYLKDTWRVNHEGTRKEGDILGYLNEQGVENIPTRLCHGDVFPPEFQATISHVVWAEENPKVLACTLKAHRHYRLVVEEVCLPMNDFVNADELIYFTTRCISAHSSAYQKGILHRDISAGNVLIFPREYIDDDGKLQIDRDGLLTDWELSKDVEEKPGAKGPRQPNRTGTWQFLSANALANPRKKIGIEDEMESFFHVLLYYACRYLPTNCPDITPFIYDYFDGYAKNGEEYSASMTKHHAMKNGEICVNSTYELVFLTSRPVEGEPTPPRHPITDLFSKLLDIFKAQYALYRMDSNKPYNSSSTAGTSISKPAQRSGRFNGWGAKYIRPQTAMASALSPASEKALHEKAAAPLKDHALMLERYMLCWLQSEQPWPAVDKIPDQMRTNYDPNKQAKDPKPSKSGKDNHHAGEPNQGSMLPPPPPSQRSSTSRKRVTLHDDDPFEDPGPSPKRPATEAGTSLHQ